MPSASWRRGRQQQGEYKRGNPTSTSRAEVQNPPSSDTERGQDMIENNPHFPGPVCCSARTRDGRNCRAPACAGDTRCRWHGGQRRLPKVCHCSAYGYPHRPGAGRCRFHEPPDPPGVFVWRSPPPPSGRNRPKGLRRRGWWRYVQQQLRLHPIRDRKRIREAVEFLQANPCVGIEGLDWWWPGARIGAPPTGLLDLRAHRP